MRRKRTSSWRRMGIDSNSAEDETTSSRPLSFVRSFSESVYTSTVMSDYHGELLRSSEKMTPTGDVIICGNHTEVERPDIHFIFCKNILYRETRELDKTNRLQYTSN
jgi:hypothetical protein